MKKRITILLVIFVASLFFVNINNVEARTAMYLQCEYTSDCKEPTWFDWIKRCDGIGTNNMCFPRANVYIPFTDSNGNLKVYAVNPATLDADFGHAQALYPLEDEYVNTDGTKGCWVRDINSYSGKSECDSSFVFNQSPATIIYDKVCPSGLLFQHGFDFLSSFTDIKFGNLFCLTASTAATLSDGKIDLSLTGYGNLFSELFSNSKSWEYVPAGKSGVVKESKSSFIDNAVYVIYSFNDENGNNHIFAEGYNDDGKYSYVGPNILSIRDDIMNYQGNAIAKLHKDFWKVHDIFEAQMIASEGSFTGDLNVCKGHDRAWCEVNRGYEVILDSNDINNSNGYIMSNVKEWYDSQTKAFDGLSKLVNVTNNNNLVKTSDDLNSAYSGGNIYSFGSNYSAEEFISDLEAAYEALDEAYSEERCFLDYGYSNEKKCTSVVGSALSYLYLNLGITEIRDFAEENSDRYTVNANYIVSALKRDTKIAVEKFMKSNNININLANVSDDLLDYLSKFYTSVSILDSYPINYYLNTNQINRVNDLRTKFYNLVERKGLEVYPVVDCKGLIGEGLIDKINSYLNIIKIAIPIILIIFGIIDFTKAVFAGDEDKMKKAQKDFIKRIGIAILIFLVPTFLNLLLRLANKAWPIISPDTCGFFENSK